MILESDVFGALMWVAIAYFVGCGAAALLFLPKGDIDPVSDRAKVLRRRVLVALTGLVVVLALAFGLQPLGSAIVIVEIGPGGDVHTTTGALYGAHPHRFQDGHSEIVRGTGRTTIVNDSTQAMRVEVVSYGDTNAAFMTQLVTQATPVPPMTTTAVEAAIDFVGPNATIPKKVEGVYAEQRHWLRW